MENLFQKLKRVRNLPLLSIRVMQEMLPGGFLTATNHSKKQNLIKKIQSERGFKTFIETGTNEGVMIDAVKDRFDQIYSIELDTDLYTRSKARFSSNQHIHILQGDSGELLGKVLADVSTPSIFWLDAHYSGGITAKTESETPILKELTVIFNHDVKGHVILIDDAWSFGTIKDYPSMSELRRFVKSKRPQIKVEVQNGIIRIDTEKH